MTIRSLENAVAPDTASIKEAMRLIDHSGLRVCYVTGKDGKLVGAVSDSELRKAILRGTDIRSAVGAIVNPDPIVLREDEAGTTKASAVVRKLLERMPDGRFVLVVDKDKKPLRLLSCNEVLGREAAPDRAVRRVLVVGGAGYLGSILSRRLLERGLSVRVLDATAFGEKPIADLRKHKSFELVNGDMRNIVTLTQALQGMDAVINLAAIVGDPACKERPEIAVETNYLANKVLAEACRYQQINRFVYASTCSVYGQMEGDKKLDEESPLNPVSLYARSKIQAEEGILSLIDENFSPTILRMGTLHGWSPRMRFDLVVNTMTKNAVKDKKIMVHGGGKQWRPLLHVEDAADAYIRCVEAPLAKVRGQVFNVGSDEQNYQIVQIAEIVQKGVPSAKLVVQGDATDPRNYFVSFDKIRNTLGFSAKHDVAESVRMIREALETGALKDPENPIYYNVETLQ